jgi:hypothetical protein
VKAVESSRRKIQDVDPAFTHHKVVRQRRLFRRALDYVNVHVRSVLGSLGVLK